MRIRDTLAMAFTALSRNSMRSMLTTLGIIIGVGSVVTMVSIGASFQSYILNQVEGISANMIEIYPKGIQSGVGRTDTISFSDATALQNLSTLTDVTPVILLPFEVSAQGETEAPMIFGTYPNLAGIYGIKLFAGRMIDLSDISAARNVAVLGPSTAEDLFGTKNVVGEKITIQNRAFTVIGVNDEAGSLMGAQLDGLVIIPFTVAKSMTSQDHVTYVLASAKTDIDLALLDITLLLRQRHGITNPTNDPEKDDFEAMSSAQATAILTTVTMSITAFLVLVAGISLLVGGVGIMNIMLVSVTERTQEIGLRKAVGATSANILWQFLFEAIVLTVLGGIIGIIGGIFIAYMAALLANYFLGDFPFTISYVSIAASATMAIVVGAVFGIFPAKKAANLTPMEAMRSE